MAILGQQHIRVGAENDAANSDSLHTAFIKVEDNFNHLFTNSSQYTNFNADTGIAITKNATLGNVLIKNTGVVNMIEGTGIRLSGSNGDVVVSVVGDSSGHLVAGVTGVGVQSTTLDVSNSPIISDGNIIVNLPTVESIEAGEYTAPTVTVDQYGRITNIANSESVGTVSNLVVTAGTGIEITGSPVTTTGNIVVTNTGVLRLTAGPGIFLSSNTGNITVSATTTQIQGTVTRVGVLSDTLVVTQSPVTTSGNIVVELPDSITLSGNLEASDISATGNLSVGGATVLETTLGVIGNANVGNIGTHVVIATGNITGANIDTAGVLTVTGNANVGNIGATRGVFTGNISVTGNANVGNVGATGAVFTGNVTSSNANVTGNLTVVNTANIATLSVTGNTTTANAEINILHANFIIMGYTTLPSGTIPDGTIAIDAGGSRLAVRIGGAWKYATLSS
jgi:hypothetical protein